MGMSGYGCVGVCRPLCLTIIDLVRILPDGTWILRYVVSFCLSLEPDKEGLDGDAETRERNGKGVVKFD